MDVVRSINRVPIRLTDERWEHIVAGHSELRDARSTILETISAPTIVRQGRRGTLLAGKRLDSHWLVVVYREVSDTDGFVITAYPARYLREEFVVWKS